MKRMCSINVRYIIDKVEVEKVVKNVGEMTVHVAINQENSYEDRQPFLLSINNPLICVMTSYNI